jgi:hypothetical protein
MNIVLKEITVRDLYKGYIDNHDEGVVAFNGLLDVRPPYQREFIYKDKQRNAVLETIQKGFPLNVMYWALREDETFEVIDGQQRTISICQYLEGDFSLNGRFFHNLQKDEQELILNYELMVYVCSGKESEKLEWFKTINIAGEKLTTQELRNAVYFGSWVTDAKRYFSKNGCAAHNLASEYMSGSYIRQEYLESAIRWISQGEIEEYMAREQHNANANELWLYFQSVIAWVNVTFPKLRPPMKGVEWGSLYNEYMGKAIDPSKLEFEISQLMMDDDVSNKKGIYEFVLTRQEKFLNIRAFTVNQKQEAYEKQKGVCIICKEYFNIDDMEADHITPWSSGGKTDSKNCQMLCKEDNRRKSNI